jgi:toxin YoeB
MHINFGPKAWRDFGVWIERDPVALRKLHALITETGRTPREGRGNPERLKHVTGELWSRRVTREHRLIYAIEENGDIVVLSMRGHYPTDYVFEKRG